MIIPEKCWTCGKVLGDKYRYYLEEVRKRKLADQSLDKVDLDQVQYLTKDNNEKTNEGHVMDQIGLTRYCCRRTILTHVDI